MTILQTEHLFDIYLKLRTPVDIGSGPEGHRLVVVIEQGHFSGPKLSGSVAVSSGADWPRIRPDGSFALDVRLCLNTDDGASIYVKYEGRLVANPPESLAAVLNFTSDLPVDPSQYYLRTCLLFETGDARYNWLNGIVAIGNGRMGHGGVSYNVSAVL